MEFIRVLRSSLVVGSLLGLCGVASATPVTYNWTSGSVTVTSFVLPSTTNILVSPSNNVPLTAGSQVTFDSAVPNVPGFLLAAAGPNTINIAPTAFSTVPLSALNGGTLVVSNLSITAGTGYVSTGAGSNPFNVTMTNLSVSGTYTLKSALNTTLWTGSFTNVQTPGPISGQVLLSGANSQQLSLNGITLAAITLPPTLGAQTLLVKGDVLFNGTTPVPLPAGVWLMGSGLLGLSRWRRRRAPAATTMSNDVQLGSGV